MSSQLMRDLRSRTVDRVCNLIKDTMSLYEMAQLPPQLGAQVLTEALMATVIQMLTCSDADPDEVGEYIAGQIKEKRLDCATCDCYEKS